MTHLTTAYLLKKLLSPARHMSAFIAGATLPDILSYCPVILGAYIPSDLMPAWIKTLPFMFLAFHCLFGFFLLSWLVALLFQSDLRRGIFINMLAGGWLHLAVDTLQVQHGEFSSLFFPFSLRSVQLGWLESETSLLGLPFFIGIAFLVIVMDYYRNSRGQNR